MINAPPIRCPFPNIPHHVMKVEIIVFKRPHRCRSCVSILCAVILRKVSLPSITLMFSFHFESIAPGKYPVRRSSTKWIDVSSMKLHESDSDVNGEHARDGLVLFSLEVFADITYFCMFFLLILFLHLTFSGILGVH